MIKALIRTIFICSLVFSESLVFAEEKLSGENFDRLEYHYNLVDNSEEHAFARRFESLIAALNFFQPSPGGREFRLEVYVDTPEQHLLQSGVVLRLRYVVSDTRKSKITLKSRAATVSPLLVIPYTKAEIDLAGEKEKYSLSRDMKLPTKFSSLWNVDLKDFKKHLKKKEKKAYRIVKSVLQDRDDSFASTPVIRVLEQRGMISGCARGDRQGEVTGFAYSDGEVEEYLFEFSFRGATRSRVELDAVSRCVSRSLRSSGLLLSDTRSKSGRMIALIDGGLK